MNNKTIYLRVIICLSLISLLLSVSTDQGKAATGISQVKITNVYENTFTVSWTTGVASNGIITWDTATPPTAHPVADPVNSTTTHYVTINNLSTSNTYYFQVTSGDETDTNSGNYYQVTTGPSVTPPTPANTVWGYVYLSNGTTVVPNAIVYLQMQDANGSGSSGSSQLVSSRADANGVWNFTLASILTSDLQNSYIYTPGADQLQIIGQGGIHGNVGIDSTWIITIPTVDPTQQNVVLSAPTPVVVYSFTGRAIINKVQLDWKTANEVGLIGFNVYRSDSLDGAKQKLNSSLLPAQNAGQMKGASYHFSDTVQQGQHFDYWLELVMKDRAQIIDPVVLPASYWILLPTIRR